MCFAVHDYGKNDTGVSSLCAEPSQCASIYGKRAALVHNSKIPQNVFRDIVFSFLVNEVL